MTIEATVKSNLPKFSVDTEKALYKAFYEIGMTAEKYAKGKCPVDTGFLRNSITFAVDGEKANISSYKDNSGGKEGSYSGSAPKAKKGQVSVYIGTNLYYARYVELGTSRMKPRPYLKPAATDSAALSAYESIIVKELSATAI